MIRKYLACTVASAALSLGIAHAATTVTINAGGSSLAYPTYIAEFALFTKSNPTTLFSYEAVGSGAGQKAFLDNDITFFEPGGSGTSNPNGYAPGTLTYGTIVGTQVDIGASDAFLSASQLTNPATGSYTSGDGNGFTGSAVDGPLIQIPTLGTAITMAYYQPLQTATLTLTDAQICGVLSGQITDWHTLNSKIPAGTTITVVVRSDGSGTTFLTTQHLNAVCNSGNSSFPEYPVPITKYFYNSSGSSSPVFPNGLPSNFVGASGSGGVQTAILAQKGGFGYLSPDYTVIAPKSANYNANVKVASVVNGINGKAYAPSVANTETGLASADTADSTNASPPSTLAAAMDPLNWVPQIPQTTSGYSIVGYTTMDLSSCYANKTAGSAIISFLTDQYNTSAYKTLITNNGLVPLSNSAASKYITAVDDDFLGNKSGYNLEIDNKTLCADYTGR
jgi:ABC-type phosphate transport system substrate-binding protein